jgi:hypothetical protein
MKYRTIMSEFLPSIVTPLRRQRACCRGSRERLLRGLALLALGITGDALGGEVAAGEQAAVTGAKLEPVTINIAPISPATGPVAPAPGDFTLPTAGGVPVFSTTEFRARKHTVLDIDPNVSAFGDTPMIHTTTVWQRLSEYKSQDRVQVLTLWQNSGSSVSLQAGKHGDPSLQWTSRLMNHGGSTQGVLDRLFSVSIAGAADGFRSATRSSSAPAAAKPVSSTPSVVSAAK